MISGSCHCGAIRVEIPAAPAEITACNCSICRRLGGLWGYYDVDAVRVHGHPALTDAYIHGDRTLRLLRCKTCGCTTHWEPLDPQRHKRLGVNIRNFEPALIEGARLRLLDGASTWTSSFADEPAAVRRINRAWHRAHRMPANPTLTQRLTWHQAHAVSCGCRPVPAAIRAARAAGG